MRTGARQITVWRPSRVPVTRNPRGPIHWSCSLQGRCRLTFELDGQRRSVEISREQYLIGRAEGCDLCIPLPSVSRLHAKLLRDSEGWIIVDENSRNGVHVNEHRISSTRLEDHDRIHLGPIVELNFQVLEAPGPRVLDETLSRTTDLAQMIDVAAFRRALRDQADNTVTGLYSGELPRVDQVSDETVTWAIPLFSKAAETLFSPTDLESMLRTVLDLVFENLPAERGCILEYDEETEERNLRVMRRKDQQCDQHFRFSDTVVRRAIKQRSAVLVIDSLADRQLSTRQSILADGIRSVMAAPLLYDQRVLGVVYVDTQNLERLFNRHHLQALTALACLSAAALHYTGMRERFQEEQRIRQRLARYSAPSVVDRIVNTASQDLGQSMMAEEREISVLFLDIVQFTGLAEKLPAREVMHLLNELFTRLTDCVFDHEGTLDKFTGDGLMAVFGAPLAQEDHALRAVRTALQMHQALAAFNEEYDQSLAIRIGINSGPALAGDVGSLRRRDYTVIGDTVNTASRLESQVANPGDVIIGAITYRSVGEEVPCEDLGPVTLRGRIRRVHAYRVKLPTS